jgi:hypothetical protein
MDAYDPELYGLEFISQFLPSYQSPSFLGDGAFDNFEESVMGVESLFFIFESMTKLKEHILLCLPRSKHKFVIEYFLKTDTAI